MHRHARALCWFRRDLRDHDHAALALALGESEQVYCAFVLDREGRRLSLTGDGQALHAPVEEAFGLINSGMNAISMRQTSVLRLHAAPSFAAQWLMPRLASFRADNPLIEVQIAADTDYVRFTGDDFDADIVYGMRSQEALMTNPLGRELIAPMCSRELAPAIRSAADLVGLPLIHSTLKYTTWADWLGANGIAPPGLSHA